MWKDPDYSKKWYQRNKERVRERNKIYRREHREEIRERDKRYNAEHREKVRKIQRLYAQRHPEVVRESSRKYRVNHKEDYAERARKYNFPFYIKGQYAELFRKQKGKCAICGNSPNGKTFHLDHKHGTETIRGLLCKSCNQALGLFKDNPKILRGAIAYLKKGGIK